MLLINQKPLEISALSLENENHPMHTYAKEYQKGVDYLRKTYGERISFKRPNFPKRVEGYDSRGRKVANMQEPISPMIIPLTSEVNGTLGLEIWSCALDNPKLLANGLWELGRRRSIMIKDASISVSLKKDPELAFFLYYKSPFFKSKLLVIDDPAAKAKQEGDQARKELELQTAIYGVLDDVEQLKVVAQAWGIAKTETKHADVIRKELKELVLANDKKRKKDPMVKGLDDFLKEMKITDAVRLRSFIKVAEDRGLVVFKEDGRYRVGERELCKVPPLELGHRFEFLCNHLGNAANRPKLQDLLRDVVNKEYLDDVKDERTYGWLARMMELPTNFKKIEEVKEAVYKCFVE